MGFISKEIGLSLAIAGFLTLVVQLFLWPALAGRFGVLRLFQLCLPCYAAVDFVQGFVRYLYHIPDFDGVTETKLWVWVGLVCCLAMKTLFSTIAFTSVTILVSYSAPRLDTLGVVNGFSQCVASGARSIGPAICGILWDTTNNAPWVPRRIRPHISFGILSILAMVAFASSLRIEQMNNRFNKASVVVDTDEDESNTTRG
jgi:MFS family permease